MNIDISKENIQPLRGGRNVAQLGTALQAQSDIDAQRQLHIQKEEHEAAIRNYQGSDPLDPWFNYIQWVEQCFPKHGHEGHIDKLIKDCLQLFEKDERYFQDRRFVKLWIKYIDCLSNPLEIYQRLYNTGIGVECAEFYRAWSCYCEESGDYKKANQVYMLGLQAGAQPMDELEQAHMNFQLFFAQRMLHDDSPTKRKAASALAETRMALTSLKTFKRRNIASAPVQRTGDNLRSYAPGVVRQQDGGSGASRGPSSNIMVNVYEDAPSTSSVPVPTAENPGPASLVQSYGNVENEKEVGIWTNAKTKMVHANVVPHQPLPFTPYEDEDLILSANHMPYCTEDLQFTVPLCVPDPPDDKKIPCYNKTSVYVDEIEYSLEEIRARKYLVQKAAKAQSLSKALAQPYQGIKNESVEPVASCSALETLANCALDTGNDHYEQLLPLNIPTLQNVTKVHNIHSPGEPKILVNLDSKEVSELKGYKKNDDNQRPDFGDKENEKVEYNENVGFGKNNIAEEFNRSLIGNFHTDSITVNTKEARWELRNLFTDNEPSMVQPMLPQFDVQKFDIHEDRSMTMALNTNKKRNSVEQEDLAPPEDKENAQKVFATPMTSVPQNANKTAFYEEPSCTQVFNFNIKNSSTPNMSQFKKPTNYIDFPNNKTPCVPKFTMEDSTDGRPVENPIKKEESSTNDAQNEQPPNTDGQGTGLSVIMESTREYNSKSGSSSSGTRTTLTGYTTRDSQAQYNERTQASNLNYDSMYNQQNEAATSKRNSISAQPRHPNGKFAKVYPAAQTAPEQKPMQPTTQMTYLHDHQYQKPVQAGYNGYTAQRTMQVHGYQQNYNHYQQGQGYGTQQNFTAQQGYPSPQQNNYSPQHPGLQSPHHIQSPTPGFQSPPLNYGHVGYQSPAQHIPTSPQPNYPNVPQHEYQANRHAYANQQQNASFQNPPQQNAPFQSPPQQNAPFQSPPQQNAPFQSPTHQSAPFQSPPHQVPFQSPPHQQAANFQSPPHQAQYQNYQRTSNYPNAQPSPASYAQQNYQNQYQPSPYQQHANHSYHNQSYNAQNQYRQQPKHIDHNYGAYPTPNANQQFQIYQSPNQTAHNSYQGVQSQNVQQERPQPMQTSPEQIPKDAKTEQYRQLESEYDRENGQYQQNASGNQPVPYKSPTSLLRSIRHEQPQGKTDAGFSNQFLNFISGRNEPKDNANTPKFSNSPNISQKMHKNLYVSSPEQAQVPPTTGQSDTERENLTARSATPIQSAKTSQAYDKQKDLSKRQLDFEQRVELQSEDSRDSVSNKEGRISTVTSRQSMHSDSCGMDMDSENSMESAALKSQHSISLIETCDLQRPADIEYPDQIDPFNKKLLKSLLKYVQFPNKTHADGYIEVRSAPKLQVGTLISVGGYKFSCEKQLGKGNYGAVFSCLDLINNKPVALKYQNPARPWEFYICQEIKARIKDPFMLPGFMDINIGFIGDNASIFSSELSIYGSLLDVANKVRVATSKCINEYIVLLLTSEMLSIVHYLHKAEIIHADIKPDNFLLMKIPAQEWRTPSLQLIDLGCAIDMSLFPEGTTFRELITTEGFTCTEMREGKPWTYQTDLYCLAGTIHVILMGSYMKVVNRLGQWNIDKKLPRYMKVSLWDKIFTTLLNVPDCATLPDLMDLKNDVDEVVCKLDNLGSLLRNFANVLKSR